MGEVGTNFPLIVVAARGADRARPAVPAPAALDRHARSGVREGHRADLRCGVGRRRSPWRTMALRLSLSRPRSHGGEGQRLFLRPRRAKPSRCSRRLSAAPDRLPVLIGNSGVGKSSLAQAGVLAALKRQAWPEEARAPNAWPAVFQDSRQWCFLTLKPGTEPIKALVECFLDTWQFEATDPERVKQQNLVGSSCCATARRSCPI